MKNLLPILFAISTVFSINTAYTQQSFQLSSKFFEITFPENQKVWDGQHRFGNVFCLKFPKVTDIKAMAEAMYNKNTLYFSRASYKESTSIYVVTSSVPADRTDEVEIENLATQNQKSVEAHPIYFKQSQVKGQLGPSLTLTVRNMQEGSQESPFPFVRNFGVRRDGLITSLSVHRLFVHRQNRIEVVGLRYFKNPLSTDDEADAVSSLSSFVEDAADSLQSCTEKLLPRKN